MNWAQMERNLRWGKYVVWAMLCVFALTALLVVGRVGGLVYREPPLRFTQDSYLPRQRVVCPGDLLDYHAELVVLRVPAVVMTVKTLWDVRAKHTVVPDTEPRFYVWSVQDRGEVIGRDITYRLPPGLAPGPYELRGGASELNSEGAAYTVPFTVAPVATCKERDAQPRPE